MADLIRIKGGNGAVPTLKDREMAYSKDEKALYIGTESGNVRLCSAEDADTNQLATKIDDLTMAFFELAARVQALEKPSE